MEKRTPTRIIIQPCKFETIGENQKVTYGYYCYAGSLKTYSDTWKEKDLSRPTPELLIKIVEEGNRTNANDILKKIVHLIEKSNVDVYIGNDTINAIEVVYLLKHIY